MAFAILKKLFSPGNEKPGAKSTVKGNEAAARAGKAGDSSSVKSSKKKKKKKAAPNRAASGSTRKTSSAAAKGNSGGTGKTTTPAPAPKNNPCSKSAEEDPAFSKRHQAFRWWKKRYSEALRLAIINKDLAGLQKIYDKKLQGTPYCHDGNTKSKFFWYFNSWLFGAMGITDSVWSFNQADEESEPDRVYRMLLILENNVRQENRDEKDTSGNDAFVPVLFDCYGYIRVVPVIEHGEFRLPKTPGTVVIVQGTKRQGKLLMSEMLHLHMYEDGKYSYDRLRNGAYIRIGFSCCDGYCIPVSGSPEDFDCYAAMMSVAEKRLHGIKSVDSRNLHSPVAKPDVKPVAKPAASRDTGKKPKDDLLICERILAEVMQKNTIEETGHAPREAVVLYPDGKPVGKIIDVKGSGVTTESVRAFLDYNSDRDRLYSVLVECGLTQTLRSELCIVDSDILRGPEDFKEKKLRTELDYFCDRERHENLCAVCGTRGWWDGKPSYFQQQWKKALLAYIPVFLQRFHKFITDGNHAPVILPGTDKQQACLCREPISEWYRETEEWAGKIRQLSSEELEKRYADDYTPNVTYVGPYMLTHPKSCSLYFLNRFWIEAHTENSLDEARLNYLFEMQDAGSTELPSGIYAVYIRSYTKEEKGVSLKLADCWGSVIVKDVKITVKDLYALKGYLLLAELTITKDSTGEFSAGIKKLMRSPFSIGKKGSFTNNRYDGRRYLFYENTSKRLKSIPSPAGFMQREYEILLAAIDDIKKRSERNGSIIDGAYTGNPFWFKKRYPSLKPVAGYGTSDGKLRLFQYGITARVSSLHASPYEQEQPQPGSVAIEYLGRSDVMFEQEIYDLATYTSYIKTGVRYRGFNARTFSGTIGNCVYEEVLGDRVRYLMGRAGRYYGPLFEADMYKKNDKVIVRVGRENYTPRSDVFCDEDLEWLVDSDTPSQAQRWYEYRFLLAEAEAKMYCEAKPNDMYIMAYNDRRHRDTIPIPEDRRYNAAILRKVQMQAEKVAE